MRWCCNLLPRFFPHRLAAKSLHQRLSNQYKLQLHQKLRPHVQYRHLFHLTMDEECTICLEPITASQRVGAVPCCAHNKRFHDTCLLQWAATSNSCPTCRQRFHRIDISKAAAPQVVLKSVNVQDKLMPNDAINHIPREFVIPAIPVEEPPEERPSNGMCYICSSSDYNSSIRNLNYCTICGCLFHTPCLGILATDNDVSTWRCPLCDNEHQFVQPYPTQRRRPATQRVLQTSSGPRIPPPPRQGRGLIIHNDFNELDDDFNDDEDDYSELQTYPVINGGVLLRKEQRDRQNLSTDELQSWDLFDQARSGTDETSSIIISNSPSNKRRRRKRITPVQGPSSSGTSVTTGSSRISNLISQMKAPPSSTFRPQRLVQPMHTPNSTAESPSLSPVNTSPMEVISIESDTDSDTKSYKRPKPELSLEQKMDIQKHIRNKLRPLYKPSDSTLSTFAITSEQDYININKTISRKIYGLILALEEQDRSLIDALFCSQDPSRLKDIIDKHVTQELDNFRYS